MGEKLKHVYIHRLSEMMCLLSTKVLDVRRQRIRRKGIRITFFTCVSVENTRSRKIKHFVSFTPLVTWVRVHRFQLICSVYRLKVSVYQERIRSRR